MIRYAAILLAFVIGCQPAEVRAKDTLTQAEVFADFDTTVKLLKQVHPNLTAHRKRRELNGLFSTIRKEIDGVQTVFEAAVHIQRALAMVCDGHTMIDGSYLSTKIRPTMYGLLDELVTVRDGRLTMYDGRTIEQLNGLSSKEAASALLSMSPWDGCAPERFYAPLFITWTPEFLFSHWLGLRDKHPAKIARRNRETPRSRDLQGTFPSTFVNIRMRRNRDTITALPGILQRQGIDLTDLKLTQRVNWTNTQTLLAFSEDRKTAYFRIEQFLESDQQRKDVNDAMREVIKASPDHVVLDLSGNPGGSINAAGHLMSYLLRRANRPASKVRLRDTAFYKRGKFTFVSKERRTQSLRAIRQFKRVGRKNGVRTLPYARRSYGNPSFNGRLTLLVGPRTFSAATMVVTTLRKNRRAPTRTVGTAMGGSSSTSCFSANGYYTLPNSGLRILIPSTCYDRERDRRNKGEELVLDVPVDPLRTSLYSLRNRLYKAAFDTSTGW